MPLFKKQKILFIHIPKTGGISISNYFCDKFNVKKDKYSFFGYDCHYNKPHHRLQHFTYSEIRDIIGEEILSYKVISCIRNPYHRIISSLFYIGKIQINSKNKYVEKVINKFINKNKWSNLDHRIPQYDFLTYNNKLVNYINIMRTESLYKDMANLGYKDFKNNLNRGYRGKFNYMDMLNENSIRIINKYYRKDFDNLGFNMVLYDNN